MSCNLALCLGLLSVTSAVTDDVDVLCGYVLAEVAGDELVTETLDAKMVTWADKRHLVTMVFYSQLQRRLWALAT